MISKILVLITVVLWSVSYLKEDALNCGGDVLIVIEDIYFCQVGVQSDETICVRNDADALALVIDAGETGKVQ